MLTTLTNRLLADTTVSYKFLNQKLTIIVDTDAAHNLFGDVNITLANCLAVAINTDSSTIATDYFNDTFLFTATSTTRMEHEVNISGGLPSSNDEVELTNDGTPITATVDNLLVSIEKGDYIFRLLDETSSVFDGSLVTVQEKNIAKTPTLVDGVAVSFDENGDTADYSSIDGQELSFDFDTDVTSTIGDTNATNIPLLINHV